MEPSTRFAFLSMIAIIYTAVRGKRVWDQQKRYHRLYWSMVSLYDHYTGDYAKFYQEIDDLSESITRYFVDDKLNDTQFDKLLTRRDDLITRARRDAKMA